MAMRLSVFAYPWDLRRIGVERALEQMAAAGFDSLYLAANYHPIDALSPRDGRVSLFASSRGAVHFPARSSRYGAIEPVTSSPEICSVWPEVAERAGVLGIALVPWTIVLYQPWIVDRHPGSARVLPSGDRTDAGVCPANDDVREYVRILCDDLVEQFGVRSIHLEGPAPASFDYGWLRPRVLVDVPRLARELLALCFCPSCRRRGANAGLDVDRLQVVVNEAIVLEMGFGPWGVTDVLEDAELHAFVELFARASVELVDAVAPSGDGTVRPRLSGMVWTPFTTLLGAHDDELFDAALGPFDQVIVAPNASDPRTRVARAARGSRGLELVVLHTPGARRAGRSQTAGTSDRTTEVLRGAIEVGAAEVAVYNFGLLRERDVHDVARRVHELPAQ
jgi:hypothetical protein